MAIHGTATDSTERFEFTIEQHSAGGYALTVHFIGDGRSRVTGAGIWPMIGKAKSIAEETASKLLHGAAVFWSNLSSN
jgi:hypothetical protein